jgi:hypothetical protein
MVGRPSSSAGRAAPARGRFLNPGRLAAALGLTSMLSSLAQPQAGASCDASSGAMSAYKAASRRVGQLRWHIATSPQHARHLLQACPSAVVAASSRPPAPPLLCPGPPSLQVELTYTEG